MNWKNKVAFWLLRRLSCPTDKKKTDRVLAAYESEIQQLANQRIDARAAIDEYEDAIKTLEERLKLLERFGQEIESKMREAQQSLLQLPNEVGRDAEAITTALSGGISNILAAGASYPGNIPGVLSNLGNALGLFSSAAKRGTELVEKLQRINVEQSLRQHMFNLSDRMAALVDKTLEGGGELRRAQVRKAYAERRQKRIDEMVQRLELLKLSEEPEKLEELLRIAEEIYAETRRRVGQTVDEYRRFADIVMRSTQAREPLSLPRGGGIRSIFNASHLDSIRSEERARYNQFSTEPPQTKTEKFTLTRSGEGKFPDFFRTLDSAINAEGTTSKYRTIQIPGSQLIDHIPYIAGARIRKVGFRLLGDNGVVSPSQFYIRHSGATGGRSNDGPLYQVATMSQRMLINEPDLPIFLFWFRSLQDAWEWSFPEKPKGAVNGVEISVDLELANLADASRSEPRRAQLLPQGVLPSCIADSP